MGDLTDADFAGATADPAAWERQYRLLRTPRGWGPLHRESPEGRVVDLSIPPESHPLYHRRILVMILLLAVKDRASAVHFGPALPSEGSSEGVLRLCYQVDGEWHEIVPPPAFFSKPLRLDLETLAGLRTPRGRIGAALRRLAGWVDGRPAWESGGFRLHLDSGPLEVVFWVHPPGSITDFSLMLSPISAAASDESWGLARRACGSDGEPDPTTTPAVAGPDRPTTPD